MKKTAISLLLALAMVFTMVLVAAPVAQAAAHTHCVCGDGKCSVGNHAHADVTWTEWTDATTLPTTTGNYYLATDVHLAARHEIAEGAKVALCLNGKKVTSDAAVYKLLGAATFTLTDCKGTGTLTGADSSGRTGGVIYADAGMTTMNLYAGNIIGPKVKSAACIYWASGTLNIYGGTLTGGEVTDRAGALNVAGSADRTIVNMYGGLIKGGKNTHDTRGGGAIRIGSHGTELIMSTFNMYGGVIDGGESKYGGSIYVQQHNNELNLYGGVIKNGKATEAGKDIYAIGKSVIKVVNMDASFTITLGDEDIKVNTESKDATLSVTENNKEYTVTKGAAPAPGGSSTPNTGDSANLVVMGLGLVLGVAGMAWVLPKKQTV